MKPNRLFSAIASVKVFLLFGGLFIGGCSQLKELKPEPGPGSLVVTEDIYPEKAYRPMEGSIWPGGTSENLLFADTKAKQVGDVVTVLIDESATSTQSATTDTSKQSSIDLEATRLLGLPTNLGVTDFLGSGSQFDPRVNAQLSRSNQGAGTTTRNGTMTGTIAAMITETLAYGNFRIEGRRTVTVNKEDQIMVLSGIIRRVDVGFDNTISSRKIADAKITYIGEGVVADEQRVGWLTRFLSVIWPF